MSTIKCPYCKCDNDYVNDAFSLFSLSQCVSCGKIYQLFTSFDTIQISCQINGKHNWKIRSKYDCVHPSRYCSECGIIE